LTDTIAAIATGGTVTAIGIIRISGEDAITVADKVFTAKNGTKLAEADNRRMYYGRLTGADSGLIDLCLCTVSRAPDSYTGEDTVELHCHGSPVALSETMRTLYSYGIRQAQAGEFTKRAFLNGRMDMTQAEAVIDLIEAETPDAARNAACQLNGAISKRLEPVYDKLVDIMAHFHAVIDYPDEDIDEFEAQRYMTVLKSARDELSQMLYTHDRGRVLRDGIPTAIIGRPNTGKSSLLNALLGYDRAIVTEHPGTTRDTIEEKVLFGGTLLRLIDTAGLRKTDDTIEKSGVGRTHAALQRAGLALLVLDGSEPLREEDHEAFQSIPEKIPKIVVINKSDLSPVLDQKELVVLGSEHALNLSPDTSLELAPELAPELTPELNPELTPERGYCRVSALTGDGLAELEAAIRHIFPEMSATPSGEIITSVRQAEAISRAASSIALAIDGIAESVTPDAVLTDIEAAVSAIGEVTGKTMREDVISRIFERFCVGK